VQQLQAELEIEKKSKEDLRHEFEAMKKESEMAMETLKKESEMARAKQAEEIEKIKKGITRNHVLPSSNAWS
jgi:thiamine biosynthesis lipoprotein ApbE